MNQLTVLRSKRKKEEERKEEERRWKRERERERRKIFSGTTKEGAGLEQSIAS